MRHIVTCQLPDLVVVLDMEISPEVRARFEEKYLGEPNSGCWLWTACLNTYGYGQFRFNGRFLLAHRFSYELYVGPIPDGLQVLHKCDVRSCIRPDHLFVGTNADNMADKASKGRAVRGADVQHSKLTEHQILDIFRAPGTKTEIAAIFGVSRQMISYIKSGKNWSHITKKLHDLAN